MPQVLKLKKRVWITLKQGIKLRLNTAAIRTFEVTLKNIERVNDLSDFSLNLKVNAIQNTEFLSSKAELLQAQATQAST